MTFMVARRNDVTQKIGIITFHRALNYGAVLQAYALCAFSNSICNSSTSFEVIDYRSRYFENLRYGIYGNNKLKSIARSLMYFIPTCKKRKGFDSFLKKITLSKKYNERSISSTNAIFSKFITGSDQVFNQDCSGEDNAFLLSFVNQDNGKYSYAASVGKTEITENERSFLAKSLNSFQRVSIREREGIDIVREILPEMPLRLDYDPVFLLKEKDWVRVANSHALKKIGLKRKFVFLYCVFFDEKMLKTAIDFAREHGFDIVAIGIPKKALKKSDNIITADECGPSDWLHLMRMATHVFTNSFHGLAFSLLFNKDFFVAHPTGERGSKLTSRIDNLLDKFAVKGRKLLMKNEYEYADYSKIDESKNSEIIDEIIDYEKTYLCSIISD